MMTDGDQPRPEARLVRMLPEQPGGAALYELSSPLSGSGYVIVSSAIIPMAGSETVILPSDADGRVIASVRLPGSARERLEHEDALSLAGYRLS